MRGEVGQVEKNREERRGDERSRKEKKRVKNGKYMKRIGKKGLEEGKERR